MHLKVLLPLFAAALAFVPITRAQNLLLSYDFEETSGAYASSGSVGQALEPTGANQTYGAPGSGVAGSRAWDASANTIQGNDGNNSLLKHAVDVNAVDALPAFTIAFWFKADQAVLTNNRFVYNANSAGTTGYSLRAISTAGNVGLQMTFGDGAVANSVTSTMFGAGAGYNQVGQWTFGAVTWDGSIVNFFSGTEGSMVTGAGSGTYGGVIASESVAFHLANIASANRGFDGSLDNFRLYDAALSMEALSALTAIPEPSTYALIMGGLALIVLGVRRRQSPCRAADSRE